MVRTFIGVALSLGLLLTVTTGGGFAQEKSPHPQNAPNDTTEGMTACMGMMQDAGVTEDGRKEMREFMKSDRAPQPWPG